MKGHIEGKPDTDGTDWTDWQIVDIIQPEAGIGDDKYEEDDDPRINTILGDPNHKITVNALPQEHTFYCEDNKDNKDSEDGTDGTDSTGSTDSKDSTGSTNGTDQGNRCNDADWVYFDAVEGHIYEIYAQDLSEYGYFIQLSLYNENMELLPVDPNSSQGSQGKYLIANNFLTFDCQRRPSGRYLIKAELASSYPPEGVAYILSVIDPRAGVYVPSNVIVIDPCKTRIDDLSVYTHARRSDGSSIFIPPGIGVPIGPDNDKRQFKFNDSTPYEDTAIEVYYKGGLIYSQPPEDKVVFGESNPNNTVEISIIATCNYTPPPPPAYTKWIKSWKESIGTAVYLPDADKNLNFPPSGNYEGDKMSNFEEYLAQSSPIHPTVPLPLHKGINLCYLAEILESARKPHTIPDNVIETPLYYYDPARLTWYFCDPDPYQRACYYYDASYNASYNASYDPNAKAGDPDAIVLNPDATDPPPIAASRAAWHKEVNCPNFQYGFTMKPHSFNALVASSPGILYLDLNKLTLPVFILRDL